eukprot:3269331-Amphidinium_carterae.1
MGTAVMLLLHAVNRSPPFPQFVACPAKRTALQVAVRSWTDAFTVTFVPPKPHTPQTQHLGLSGRTLDSRHGLRPHPCLTQFRTAHMPRACVSVDSSAVAMRAG